ncbi:uncharacterized protein LOC112271521 [Brachypodium distachyon]|uniref:uncharacterized protein LOC112271521 n=1 Tax=Brachypodium distachyon TaxID=15368 RepID=UPI000D0D6DCB|nr:uncharacterized protein LOC112271521 [Brachypodium distachyon]|eukprot:XP_024316531.1 uncharacterized protein LOC112271521 [Brachypodium distachyon]
MDTEAQWHGAPNCSSLALHRGEEMLNQTMLMQVKVLNVFNVIFVGILVGIGTYMPHYRHRPVIRFFFLGAAALLLPSISYVVSNGSTNASTHTDLSRIFQLTDGSYENLSLSCISDMHLLLTLLWVGLAQIIAINTSTIVAADDREGRNNGLPVQLLAQAMWTSYLALYQYDPFRSLPPIFALFFAKMVLKHFAFWMARRSLAHGRNPRLIVGYMMQLHEKIQHAEPIVELQVAITSEQLQEERQQVEQKLETTSEQSQEETQHGVPAVDKHRAILSSEKKTQSYFMQSRGKPAR